MSSGWFKLGHSILSHRHPIEVSADSELYSELHPEKCVVEQRFQTQILQVRYSISCNILAKGMLGEFHWPLSYQSSFSFPCFSVSWNESEVQAEEETETEECWRDKNISSFDSDISLSFIPQSYFSQHGDERARRKRKVVENRLQAVSCCL